MSVVRGNVDSNVTVGCLALYPLFHPSATGYECSGGSVVTVIYRLGDRVRLFDQDGRAPAYSVIVLCRQSRGGTVHDDVSIFLGGGFVFADLGFWGIDFLETDDVVSVRHRAHEVLVKRALDIVCGYSEGSRLVLDALDYECGKG